MGSPPQGSRSDHPGAWPWARAVPRSVMAVPVTQWEFAQLLHPVTHRSTLPRHCRRRISSIFGILQRSDATGYQTLYRLGSSARRHDPRRRHASARATLPGLPAGTPQRNWQTLRLAHGAWAHPHYPDPLVLGGKGGADRRKYPPQDQAANRYPNRRLQKRIVYFSKGEWAQKYLHGVKARLNGG
jgi:hypothetical protein